MDKLEEIKKKVMEANCCQLEATRTNLVFGEGDPNADIMFIGEAPGFHEDQQGRPFVGAAGKLLSELLASIGLRRDDVYITNVLKCRPPGNRDPRPEEIAFCKPFLLEQIEAIDPIIICTLGNFATKLITNLQKGISKLHGLPIKVEGRTVFPLYHPAAALYTPANVEILKEDFKKLGELLEKLKRGNEDEVREEIDNGEGKGGEQLELWS